MLLSEREHAATRVYFDYVAHFEIGRIFIVGIWSCVIPPSVIYVLQYSFLACLRRDAQLSLQIESGTFPGTTSCQPAPSLLGLLAITSSVLLRHTAVLVLVSVEVIDYTALYVAVLSTRRWISFRLNQQSPNPRLHNRAATREGSDVG